MKTFLVVVFFVILLFILINDKIETFQDKPKKNVNQKCVPKALLTKYKSQQGYGEVRTHDKLRKKKTILTREAAFFSVRLEVAEYDIFNLGSVIKIGSGRKTEKRSVVKINPKEYTIEINKPIEYFYPEKTIVEIISDKDVISEDDKLTDREKNQDFTKKNARDVFGEDSLLNAINKLKDSSNFYHPNEISRYASKLNFLKNYTKKPNSKNCNIPTGKHIAVDVDDKLKEKLFKTVDTKSLLTIGLNRWDILNPTNQNTILPETVFSYQGKSRKRVLDFDVFKTEILDKITKYNSVNEPDSSFKEIENPKLNIYKKNKLTKIPYQYLFRILDQQKTLIDKLFFQYIKTPNKQIHCDKPIEKNCSTRIIHPQIYKILESVNWYKFIFRYNYYIKDKVFAYTIFSKTFVHKNQNIIRIQELNLKGLLHEQNINLKEGLHPDNTVQIHDNAMKRSDSVFSLYKPQQGYLYDDNEEPLLFDKKEQVKIVRQHKKDYDDRITKGSEVPQWYKPIVNKPMTKTNEIEANQRFITRT